MLGGSHSSISFVILIKRGTITYMIEWGLGSANIYSSCRPPSISLFPWFSSYHTLQISTTKVRLYCDKDVVIWKGCVLLIVILLRENLQLRFRVLTSSSGIFPEVDGSVLVQFWFITIFFHDDWLFFLVWIMTTFFFCQS